LPGGSVVIFKGRWDFINRGRERLFDAILSSVRFLENQPTEACVSHFMARHEPLAANMHAWVLTTTDAPRMVAFNVDLLDLLEKHNAKCYRPFP
jgi:hypothetical protein